MIDLKSRSTRPVAQLVLDLERRGLAEPHAHRARQRVQPGHDDRRQAGQDGERPGCRADIINEMKYYGMHRHFTDAGSVLLIGGGMKKGYRTVEPRMSGPARPSRNAW